MINSNFHSIIVFFKLSIIALLLCYPANLNAQPANIIDINKIIEQQREILKKIEENKPKETTKETNKNSPKNLDKNPPKNLAPKVDIESLGLDNVEKTDNEILPTNSPNQPQNKDQIANKKSDQASSPENPQNKTATPEKKSDQANLQDVKKIADNLVPTKANSENSKNLKPEELEPKITSNTEEDQAKLTNKSKNKYVRNRKKSDSTENNQNKSAKIWNDYLENEKNIFLQQIKDSENKKAQEKLLRYQKIRDFYLNADLEKSTENADSDNRVVPHKKALAPFAIDELPPLPILNRSRSEDNYHIPFVYTPQEYIDILFSAISLGSVSYFNEAFKYVLNPNVTNQQGDTLLTYAIYLRKYAIVASILAKGGDPNLANKLGHLPVSIAIEMLDFVALEMLAKNQADLKYKDAFGRNFLMHAARVGFLPAVDLFVKSGIDINEMDNDGITALSIAYRHKKELIVQYLLKNGAKTWIEKDYIPSKKYLIDDLNNRWKD